MRVPDHTQIQAQPGFRHGLAGILARPDVFEPLFSPAERPLRIRPVCPHCALVDKTARTVQPHQDHGHVLAYQCGTHGKQETRLYDLTAVIDADTPVRTVLRSLCFALDRDQYGAETIVLNDAT